MARQPRHVIRKIFSPLFPAKSAHLTTTSTSRHERLNMAPHRTTIQTGSKLASRCLSRNFATSNRRRAGEIRIVEVGPRDGLQNEKISIPVATKLELIRRLSQTGVRNIEAGSFVPPKWVPQVCLFLRA